MTSGRHQIEVIGHRGARALALENSLPAFELAFDLGVDAVELDVVLTGDGKLVVFHDAVVTTAEGKQQLISRTSLRDLRARLAARDARYAAPGAVPELHELAQLTTSHGSTARLDLEMKVATPDLGTEVEQNLLTGSHALITAYGLTERTAILAFDLAVLEHSASLAPDVPRALNLDATSWARQASRLGAATARDWNRLAGLLASLRIARLQPKLGLLSADLVARCRAHGIGVVPWVVNTAEEFGFARRVGADGVCTDVPDRLLTLRSADGI